VKVHITSLRQVQSQRINSVWQLTSARPFMMFQ
jgi:hypothetical protein